jgi:hypothetical protein
MGESLHYTGIDDILWPLQRIWPHRKTYMDFPYYFHTHHDLVKIMDKDFV